MYKRNFRRFILVCVLATVICESPRFHSWDQQTRRLRHASCPSCRRERPDALVSWVSPPRREYHNMGSETDAWQAEQPFSPNPPFHQSPYSYPSNSPYNRAARSRGTPSIVKSRGTYKRENPFTIGRDPDFDVASAQTAPVHSLIDPASSYQSRFPISRTPYRKPSVYDLVRSRSEVTPTNRYTDYSPPDSEHFFESAKRTANSYGASKMVYGADMFLDDSIEQGNPMMQPEQHSTRQFPYSYELQPGRRVSYGNGQQLNKQISYGNAVQPNRQVSHGLEQQLNKQISYGNTVQPNRQVPYGAEQQLKQISYGNALQPSRQVPYGVEQQLNKQVSYGNIVQPNRQDFYGVEQQLNKQISYGNAVQPNRQDSYGVEQQFNKQISYENAVQPNRQVPYGVEQQLNKQISYGNVVEPSRQVPYGTEQHFNKQISYGNVVQPSRQDSCGVEQQLNKQISYGNAVQPNRQDSYGVEQQFKQISYGNAVQLNRQVPYGTEQHLNKQISHGNEQPSIRQVTYGNHRFSTGGLTDAKVQESYAQKNHMEEPRPIYRPEVKHNSHNLPPDLKIFQKMQNIASGGSEVVNSSKWQRQVEKQGKQESDSHGGFKVIENGEQMGITMTEKTNGGSGHLDTRQGEKQEEVKGKRDAVDEETTSSDISEPSKEESREMIEPDELKPVQAFVITTEAVMMP